MKKQLVMIGIMIILIAGGLSGCIETNQEATGDTNHDTNGSQNEEKFTTLPDGTNVTGDIDKLEILNYFVVTEKKVNGSLFWNSPWDTYEKIADGFVYSENATRYRINVTVKNIAGELLDDITIYVRYYDNLSNLLRSDYDYGYNLYIEDTIDFSFTWYNSSYSSYFEHVDHISFEILAS